MIEDELTKDDLYGSEMLIREQESRLQKKQEKKLLSLVKMVKENQLLLKLY